MLSSVLAQVRRNARLILALYVPSVGLLVTLGLLGLFTDIDPSKLTVDPARVTQAHPLAGFVSNLGALLWAATATVALYTGAILRARGVEGAEQAYWFSGGALTVVLLVDDLFMVHEDLGIRWFGIDQRITIGVYGLLALAWVVRFRQRILASDYVLFAATGCLFGLSVGMDQIDEGIIRGHLLFEDGFKFLGICSWLGFFLCTSFTAIQAGSSVIAGPEPAA